MGPHGLARRARTNTVRTTFCKSPGLSSQHERCFSACRTAVRRYLRPARAGSAAAITSSAPVLLHVSSRCGSLPRKAPGMCRRCAPPHEHPPHPPHSHHTTPARSLLTVRVLRRRRSQRASRWDHDLHLRGGASLNQGCAAAAPSWRSRRTQLKMAASPGRSAARL